MSYLLLHHPHLLSVHLRRVCSFSALSISPRLFSKFLFLRLVIQSLSLRFWITFAVSLAIIPVVLLSVFFLKPHFVDFHYSAAESCFFNPTLLPSTVQQTSSQHFEATQPARISIGNLPLFSSTTCLQLSSFADDASIEQITLQSPIGMSKKITVTAAAPPMLKQQSDPDQPVSMKQPLVFSLSQAESLSEYNLSLNEMIVGCDLHEREVHCPIDALQLIQGQSYTYTLIREYKKQPKNILSGIVRLIDPLILARSTPEHGQTVFEPLSHITLAWNKPIKEAGIVSLKADGLEEETPIQTSQDGTLLIITTKEPLKRGVGYTLTITSAAAQDGAFLDKPAQLQFRTSTGPKVTAVNLPTYKVSLAPTIIITFDIDLSTQQNISQYIKITADGHMIDARLAVVGAAATITPASSLAACSRYTITVSDDIQSAYGISGGSAWNYTFRTICQQRFSIGTSVSGRPINAFKFGTGPKLIVFIGGTHGDEKSSIVTLQAWAEELEQKYDTIPNFVTVVVIPVLNPDGSARSRRINDNNVDLNRNFPSNNWSSTAYLPGNVLLENGGGTQPLSEPESATLATYIQSARPDLILTYHASGSVVIANDSGNSHSLAGSYSAKSGFLSSSSAHEDGIFSYPTTGEFETWAHDKLDIPTLLIELRSLSNNELRTQSTAMWAMLH